MQTERQTVKTLIRLLLQFIHNVSLNVYSSNKFEIDLILILFYDLSAFEMKRLTDLEACILQHAAVV